jgi:hypothetical protein
VKPKEEPCNQKETPTFAMPAPAESMTRPLTCPLSLDEVVIASAGCESPNVTPVTTRTAAASEAMTLRAAKRVEEPVEEAITFTNVLVSFRGSERFSFLVDF